MITITNQDAFAQVIADALASAASNTVPDSQELRSCVNAIAKAAAQIEQRGCFMDYDAGRLLIWSESNEIYEIDADGRCQCKAYEFHALCWHRAAKRLIERYNEATTAPADASTSVREAAGYAALTTKDEMKDASPVELTFEQLEARLCGNLYEAFLRLPLMAPHHKAELLEAVDLLATHGPESRRQELGRMAAIFAKRAAVTIH